MEQQPELSAYERRNLVAHLAHAGRSEELYGLLGATGPDGVNTWFGIRAGNGERQGYLADIDLARLLIDEGGSASGVRRALQLRYALMSASVREAGAQVSLDLFRALLDAGVWSASSAYDHAQGVADLYKRVQMLVMVIGHCNEPIRRQVVREALNTARSDDETCFAVMPSILPLLDPQDRCVEIAEVLDRLSRDNNARSAQLLLDIAPHLEQCPQLLAAMERVVTSDVDVGRQMEKRKSTYHGFGAWVSSAQENDLLREIELTERAEAGREHARRRLALAIAMPEQRSRLIVEAITIAEQIDGDFYRSSVVVDLCPFVRDRAGLVARLIACAGVLREPGRRALALVEILPLVEGRAQRSMLDDVLRIARLARTGHEQITAVEILAKLIGTGLSGPQDALLAEALDVIGEVRSAKLNHHMTLACLAPHLTGRRKPLERALGLLSPDDPLASSWCVVAIRDLAAPLSGFSDLVDRAMTIARSIPERVARADAEVALSAGFPAERRSALLRDLLKDVSSTDDSIGCSRALAGLAAVAAATKGTSWVPLILDAAASLPAGGLRARVLIPLVHRLPAPHNDQVMQLAIAEARQDESLFSFAYAVGDLADDATPDQLARLEPTLIDALRATEPGYSLGPIFADAVLALLPSISRCSLRTVGSAVDFLLALPGLMPGGEDMRAYLLAKFVPMLDGDLLKTAAKTVLDAAPGLAEQSALRGSGRADLIAMIGPHLARAPKLAGRAMDLARAFEGHRQRATAVVRTILSVRGSSRRLDQALETLLELPLVMPNGDRLRTSALLAVVPAMMASRRRLARVSGAVLADPEPSSALRLAVARTACRKATSKEVDQSLLDDVAAIPDGKLRVSLLAALRGCLTPAQRRAAGEDVLAALSASPRPRQQEWLEAATFANDSSALAMFLLNSCVGITQVGDHRQILGAVLDGTSPDGWSKIADVAFRVALAMNDPADRYAALVRLRSIEGKVTEEAAARRWRMLTATLAGSYRKDRLGDVGGAAAIALCQDDVDAVPVMIEDIFRVRKWWP